MDLFDWRGRVCGSAIDTDFEFDLNRRIAGVGKNEMRSLLKYDYCTLTAAEADLGAVPRIGVCRAIRNSSN